MANAVYVVFRFYETMGNFFGKVKVGSHNYNRPDRLQPLRRSEAIQAIAGDKGVLM